MCSWIGGRGSTLPCLTKNKATNRYKSVLTHYHTGALETVQEVLTAHHAGPPGGTAQPAEGGTSVVNTMTPVKETLSQRGKGPSLDTTVAPPSGVRRVGQGAHPSGTTSRTNNTQGTGATLAPLAAGPHTVISGRQDEVPPTTTLGEAKDSRRDRAPYIPGAETGGGNPRGTGGSGRHGDQQSRNTSDYQRGGNQHSDGRDKRGNSQHGGRIAPRREGRGPRRWEGEGRGHYGPPEWTIAKRPREGDRLPPGDGYWSRTKNMWVRSDRSRSRERGKGI